MGDRCKRGHELVYFTGASHKGLCELIHGCCVSCGTNQLITDAYLYDGKVAMQENGITRQYLVYRLTPADRKTA